MYEYGNARIAAMRGRLLTPADLRALAEAGSPAGALALLERTPDWRPILRDVAPLAVEPGAVIEDAIERHRSARLAALAPMYPQPERSLVEALVLPLDAERVVSLIRRRRAGESAEAISATIVGGALLGPADLGTLARAHDLRALVALAAGLGLILREDGRRLGKDTARLDVAPEGFEAAFTLAVDRARLARSAGPGGDATLVRAVVTREIEERAAAIGEVAAAGTAAAAASERASALARLDGLARVARRDPLGIGVVAGYVAAVEAQAIRLRAALARVLAGWSPELVGAYLAFGDRLAKRPAEQFGEG